MARKRTVRRSTAHCRTGIGVHNTHAFLLQPGAELLTYTNHGNDFARP